MPHALGWYSLQFSNLSPLIYSWPNHWRVVQIKQVSTLFQNFHSKEVISENNFWWLVRTLLSSGRPNLWTQACRSSWWNERHMNCGEYYSVCRGWLLLWAFVHWTSMCVESGKQFEYTAIVVLSFSRSATVSSILVAFFLALTALLHLASFQSASGQTHHQ